MRRPKGDSDDLAVRAVLAAAAQEAEELLAGVMDLKPGSIDEAFRRLRRFQEMAERA